MEIPEFILIIESLYQSYGYLIVFLSSFVEITPLGFTIPGGIMLATGGFFAYGGRVALMGILISGWLGAWLTFVLAYFLGLKTGHWSVKKLKQEENAQKAKRLLRDHGGVILTTSMLANLTRFWVAYAAGEERYSFIKFLIYSGVASLTWTSLMVTLGYFAGSERGNLERLAGRVGVSAWVFLIIALLTLFLVIKKDFKKFKV